MGSLLLRFFMLDEVSCAHMCAACIHYISYVLSPSYRLSLRMQTVKACSSVVVEILCGGVPGVEPLWADGSDPWLEPAGSLAVCFLISLVFFLACGFLLLRLLLRLLLLLLLLQLDLLEIASLEISPSASPASVASATFTRLSNLVKTDLVSSSAMPSTSR